MLINEANPDCLRSFCRLTNAIVTTIINVILIIVGLILIFDREFIVLACFIVLINTTLILMRLYHILYRMANGTNPKVWFYAVLIGVMAVSFGLNLIMISIASPQNWPEEIDNLTKPGSISYYLIIFYIIYSWIMVILMTISCYFFIPFFCYIFLFGPVGNPAEDQDLDGPAALEDLNDKTTLMLYGEFLGTMAGFNSDIPMSMNSPSSGFVTIDIDGYESIPTSETSFVQNSTDDTSEVSEASGLVSTITQDSQRESSSSSSPSSSSRSSSGPNNVLVNDLDACLVESTQIDGDETSIDNCIFEISEDSPACTICMIPYNIRDNIRKLGCGHFYHQECIDQWFKKSRRCPYCKQDIVSSNLLMRQSSL